MSLRLCDGIEFLKRLPDKSVDGIFTDPPWGKGAEIQGQERWKELVKSATDECPRILKPGGRVLIWVGMAMLGDLCQTVRALEYKWTVFCRFVPPRFIAGFVSDFDPIVYFGLPGEFRGRLAGRKSISSEYQRISRGRKDTLHPCARPFETVRDILRDWFEPGEYVIDPFAGSDTTGVACREIGIHSDSCEIDPVMYATGVRRDAQMRFTELDGVYVP